MNSLARTTEIGLRHLLVGSLGLLLLGGCAEIAQRIGEGVDGALKPSRSQQFTEVYHGPKALVDVKRFDVTGRAPPDLGEGMADMLRVALAESGRFTPIEDLDSIKGGSSVELVKRSDDGGADLLVVGAVTAFERAISGNQARILPNSAFGKWLGSTVLAMQSDYIAMNVRLIDAKTGHIVSSKTVSGRTSDVNDLSFAGGELGLGLQGHARTPMEQAIRSALEDAVVFLIDATPTEYFQPR
jgi:curli biogenesis system outer membrane secretion channel CsgG